MESGTRRAGCARGSSLTFGKNARPLEIRHTGVYAHMRVSDADTIWSVRRARSWFTVRQPGFCVGRGRYFELGLSSFPVSVAAVPMGDAASRYHWAGCRSRKRIERWNRG